MLTVVAEGGVEEGMEEGMRCRCKQRCAGCVQWSCWQHWRGWCKPVVAAFYALVLVAAIPLLIHHFKAGQNHIKMAIWLVAGLFVLLTMPVFLAGLVQHVLNYTQPHLQKHIIRSEHDQVRDCFALLSFTAMHACRKLSSLLSLNKRFSPPVSLSVGYCGSFPFTLSIV